MVHQIIIDHTHNLAFHFLREIILRLNIIHTKKGDLRKNIRILINAQLLFW